MLLQLVAALVSTVMAAMSLLSATVMVPGMSREGVPPPPPVVTEVPAPTPTAIPYQLSRDEMTGLLVSTGWPEHALEEALVVSRCESGWKPSNANWSDQADGKGSTGLFQLWSGWYVSAGESYDQWMVPEVNSRAALYAWQRSGWSPWGCRPW